MARTLLKVIKPLSRETIQTGICKLFDYGIGITGLSESRAEEAGIDFIKVINASPDKPGFYGGQIAHYKNLLQKKRVVKF